ncbi:ComF family protein [Paenibacillus sp. M.A.Huq-81]
MSRRSFLYNRSAVAYDSVMREWLAQYKYRGNERLAPLLAEMLLPALVKLAGEAKRRLEGPCHPLPGKSTVSGQTFSKLSLLRNHENDNLWQSWDAITYVPISAERAEERGFNQAEQMAVHLSSTLRIPLYELLIRPKHSGKMSFKSRAERIRGSQSLFEANAIAVCSLLGTSSIGSHVHQPSLKQAPLNIVLVDDIYTTGSTAQSCASALKNSIVRPINVYVLTWARS